MPGWCGLGLVWCVLTWGYPLLPIQHMKLCSQVRGCDVGHSGVVFAGHVLSAR